MTELQEKLALPESLNLRDFENGIINLRASGRELNREDVALLRRRLAEVGYIETESWIATEGMSWLSNGIKTVSLRVAPR